jgi:hypothetical protein
VKRRLGAGRAAAGSGGLREAAIRRRASPAIAAAIPALLYLLYVSHYSINVPFADDWNVIDIASSALHNSLSMDMLWAQYSNTRLFVPYLFFAGFARLNHLDERTIALFSAALFVATFGLLLLPLRAYLRRRLTFVPVFSLGVVWFSVADVQNSLWSFQLGWYLVVFFFVAMTAFLVCRDHRPNSFFALGLVAAVLASLTEIQGFAVWGVGLICILWKSPWGRRTSYEAAIWLSTAALTAAIYFYDFNRGGGEAICRYFGMDAERCSTTFGLLHPVELGRYVTALVGNVVPTPPGDWVWAHQLLGGLICICAAFVVVQSLRERRLGVQPLPLLLIAFAVQFDLMVALGRVGRGVDNAGANRYTMPNLILVCGILVYALAHVRFTRPGFARNGDGVARRQMLGAVAVTVFLLVQGVVATQFGLTYGRVHNAYSTDVARIIVNLEAVPEAQRNCFLLATLLGPPPLAAENPADRAFQRRKSAELAGLMHLNRYTLITDQLSLYRGTAALRYLAQGPPREVPDAWWRTNPTAKCD